MTDSFRCGWNDLAHGILTWIPHEKWQSALEWALYCKELASGEQYVNEYHKGVIAAAKEYQKTGRIKRV